MTSILAGSLKVFLDALAMVVTVEVVVTVAVVVAVKWQW